MFYAQKIKQEQPPKSKGNLNAAASQTTLGALGDRYSTGGGGGATPAQLGQGRDALLQGDRLVAQASCLQLEIRLPCCIL